MSKNRLRGHKHRLSDRVMGSASVAIPAGETISLVQNSPVESVVGPGVAMTSMASVRPPIGALLSPEEIEEIVGRRKPGRAYVLPEDYLPTPRSYGSYSVNPKMPGSPGSLPCAR